MASLLDFYQPASATPQSFSAASYDQQAGDATTNAGLSMALQGRTFNTRTLPDIVNGQAARGAFFSGATGMKADRAKEDYLTQAGDTQRTLDQTLAGLARNRILSSLGVAL